MISSILSFLSGVSSAVGGYLAYKKSSNKQRRDAESDVADQEAVMEAKKNEIREAVYAGDDETLNKIASRLLAPVLAVAAGALVLGCALKPAVVYVPTDRRIESCTNSLGIACKAVPDAVMVEMLEKLEELKALKTEMKVDKRVEK